MNWWGRRRRRGSTTPPDAGPTAHDLAELDRDIEARRAKLELQAPEADQQGEILRRARERNHLADRIRLALEGGRSAPPAS